jgi:hypothetical protein
MNLTELEHAVEFTLPVPSILHRVQRRRARRGSVAVGPLRIPPRGKLFNRFDLVADETAYFGDSAKTAVYETLARREVVSLAMVTLVDRVLLTLQTTAPLRLLDLRFHAGDWPVLQSLRYNVTQGLARDAHALGYDGIIYQSAQQYGSDCVVLFGADAMRCMRLVSKLPLVSPAGALHRAAVDAIRGAQIPLTP